MSRSELVNEKREETEQCRNPSPCPSKVDSRVSRRDIVTQHSRVMLQEVVEVKEALTQPEECR